MEKSKDPTFSREALDFHEFKRGWQTIGVYSNDANQVEQIKHTGLIRKPVAASHDATP